MKEMGDLMVNAKPEFLNVSKRSTYLFSDRRHFGLIVSQGRGKYACHVCEEYKVSKPQIFYYKPLIGT